MFVIPHLPNLIFSFLIVALTSCASPSTSVQEIKPEEVLRIAGKLERQELQTQSMPDQLPVSGGCLIAHPGIRFPTLFFQTDCDTRSQQLVMDLDSELLPLPFARVGALRYEPQSQQLAILLDPDGSGDYGLWIARHGSVLTQFAAGPIHDAQWLGQGKIIFTRQASGAVPQLFSVSLSSGTQNKEVSLKLTGIEDLEVSSSKAATLLLEPQIKDEMIIHDATSSLRWVLSPLDKNPAPILSQNQNILDACSSTAGMAILTMDGINLQQSGEKKRGQSSLAVANPDQIVRLHCQRDGNIFLVRRENYEQWIEIINLNSQQPRILRFPLSRLSPIPLTPFISMTPFFGKSEKVLATNAKENHPGPKVEQRFIETSDGQRIPVVISPGDPNKPVLLRTYGAYGEYLAPTLGPTETALQKEGFSIAFASLRGGGENGRDWQGAGQGIGKLEAMNDLVLVARDLSAGKKRKVFLFTRSAGALTARGAIQQAPDLFAGVVLDAPLLNVPDIDPNSQFSVEDLEWGDAATRLKINQKLDRREISCETLPPILLIGSESDNRTPLQPMLRFRDRCPQKILLELSNRASHDGENTRGDEFYRDALIVAFIQQQL